jgi:hypothetical protein
MKTGDKDLDKWINFFSKENKNLIKYIHMLKHNDKTFLTKGFPQDIDDENLLPLNGLLEKYFIEILKNEKKDLTENYNLLVLAVNYNVNFESWKNIYKEKINQVFEESLIQGTYEEFGLELEKIISIFINKGLINKKNFMAIAILRGMNLGKKYNSLEKEKTLKKIIKNNNLKLNCYSLNYWFFSLINIIINYKKHIKYIL